MQNPPPALRAVMFPTGWGRRTKSRSAWHLAVPPLKFWVCSDLSRSTENPAKAVLAALAALVCWANCSSRTPAWLALKNAMAARGRMAGMLSLNRIEDF